MSYDESLCPIPPHRGHLGDGRAHDERIRELALEAAKERSLAEQATRARNTAQARVRELEAELAHQTQRAGLLEEACVLRLARAEKAEARVAELEAMRVAVAEEVGWGVVDAVEAREREGR